MRSWRLRWRRWRVYCRLVGAHLDQGYKLSVAAERQCRAEAARRVPE